MRATETSDRQYEGRLIDEYEYLTAIREIAVEEKAERTVKAIDKKIEFIKATPHNYRLRFAVRLTAIFSAILHRFSLKGVSLPA
ncbi:MAG: hypothetical protein NC084_10650 [Bacteroides sp.]|nr:hypothetical protein [Eubacterium sp.]MCM1419315.1 hypothetical protein [Roseburia sp.]MCM1463157.1 hypothetical protein [Bacteroides sp.]